MKCQFQTNLEEFLITIYTQGNVNPCLPQDYVGIANQLPQYSEWTVGPLSIATCPPMFMQFTGCH